MQAGEVTLAQFLTWWHLHGSRFDQTRANQGAFNQAISYFQVRCNGAGQGQGRWPVRNTVSHPARGRGWQYFDEDLKGELGPAAFAALHADLCAHGYRVPPTVAECLATLDADGDGVVWCALAGDGRHTAVGRDGAD